MSTIDHQQALGVRLREIRQQQGLTLQQVEEDSGGTWKAVVVGSYERGDRAVSIAKLAQLADFYRVPLSELLPAPAGARPAEAATRRPPVAIDLNRLQAQLAYGPEGAAAEDDAPTRPLSRYLDTIRIQRGDYDGRVLTLRRADLQALAIVLDVGADELLATLGRRGLLLMTGDTHVPAPAFTR